MEFVKSGGCRRGWLLLGTAVFAMAMPVRADVRLSKVFSDHMMVQRDLPVRVWGWADPGQPVEVTLAGKSAATAANGQGRWQVELPALKSGDGLELQVKGKQTLTIKDILVGDIWVCSGQSNMEMALRGCSGAEADIQAAKLPKIRRIKFQHLNTPQAQEDAVSAGAWHACAPESAGGFTAVGFYFAREIHQQTGVPIGIVDTNFGGTRIEPWIAEEGLALFDTVAQAKHDQFAAYQKLLVPKLDEMERWLARTRSQVASGEPIASPPAIPPMKDDWHGLYHAMIHPLVRMPIKGVLWYQGESNGTEGDSYYQKMRGLIGGWRKVWKQGDFPFYYVQLASYQGVSKDPAGGDGWAAVRVAQSKALDIPHTGMAVTIDTVPLADAGNIHPKNKYDVGMRLARWALQRDYGKQGLVPSGPLFKSLKIAGGKAYVTFDYVGGGLMAGAKRGREAVVEQPGGALKRFAIAGADKTWHWAEAVIDGGQVVVSSPEVSAPVAVRYAYQMNPDGANLYNRDGLPASPFRSDDW